MSQRTRTSVCARVAAVLAASVLSVGLLAPSASAVTVGLDPVLTATCETDDFGDGPGLYCDANDITGLLSGVLTPVFNITCINPEAHVGICRVDKDEVPDNN